MASACKGQQWAAQRSVGLLLLAAAPCCCGRTSDTSTSSSPRKPIDSVGLATRLHTPAVMMARPSSSVKYMEMKTNRKERKMTTVASRMYTTGRSRAAR